MLAHHGARRAQVEAGIVRLVSPRACRRIGWEAGDGHGQAVCSATRACLMDRAAQGTIAVHDYVPCRCRLVCVCDSGARLARSGRARGRCPGASWLYIHHIKYM